MGTGRFHPHHAAPAMVTATAVRPRISSQSSHRRDFFMPASLTGTAREEPHRLLLFARLPAGTPFPSSSLRPPVHPAGKKRVEIRLRVRGSPAEAACPG